MAFVSVSGDFCQAQHLVIVDKWKKGLPYEDNTTWLPILHSALLGSVCFCPKLVYESVWANPGTREWTIFPLYSANWSSLLSWMG